MKRSGAPNRPLHENEPAIGLLLMGVWLGLSYGLIEGVEVMTLGLIPGALAWRNANSAQILWFAPLFYGVLFGLIGGLLALIARLAPRPRWDLVLFFLAAWAGVFLAGMVHPQLFSPLAAAILGLGVAFQLTRWFNRRRPTWHRFMRRSLPLLAFAVVLLAGGMVAAGWARERFAVGRLASPPADAPNVLLLVLDTERADHLSSYGYGRPTTPNLDSLAAEGALFEQAYAASSWTLPSHASMFVGRPLRDHKAGLMRQPYLDDRFPTLAEVLRANGYTTGGFVANTYWVGRQTGLNRGFVHYEDMYDNLGDAAARTALGRLLAYDVLPRYGRIDVPGRKYAEEINRDLLEWIDGAGGRPFFAFANYFDVHGPYLPPALFAGRISPLPPRERSTEIEIGALTGDIVLPPPDELQRMIDRYDESLMYLDAQLGALFRALEDRGILDETIVIVTSDHGESWGEHGLLYHGHSLYREQLHVPLLVRYPAAVGQGTRLTAAVGLEQLPSTVLDLAGLENASFDAPSFFDVAAAWTVTAEVGRRSQTEASWPSSRGWLASVLTDRWHYIRHEADGAELYDVLADPSETVDLAARDSAALLPLARMLDRLLLDGELDPMPAPWEKLFGGAAAAESATR